MIPSVKKPGSGCASTSTICRFNRVHDRIRAKSKPSRPSKVVRLNQQRISFRKRIFLDPVVRFDHGLSHCPSDLGARQTRQFANYCSGGVTSANHEHLGAPERFDLRHPVENPVTSSNFARGRNPTCSERICIAKKRQCNRTTRRRTRLALELVL